MIQCSKNLRLPPESGDARGIERESGGQHLQRDVAAQVGIAGAIDLAHTTAAEQRDHFVGAEALSGVQGHAECESSAPGVNHCPRRTFRGACHAFAPFGPVCCLALLSGAAVYGQGPTFEAVSIKANRSAESRSSFRGSLSGISVTNQTVIDIIRNVWNVNRLQIVGGPSWARRRTASTSRRRRAGRRAGTSWSR
jgi:hypothetical protein